MFPYPHIPFRLETRTGNGSGCETAVHPAEVTFGLDRGPVSARRHSSDPVVHALREDAAEVSEDFEECGLVVHTGERKALREGARQLLGGVVGQDLADRIQVSLADA
jgi:hypothetical protein